MKRPTVHDIVFRRLWPNPKQSQPQTFFMHVQRNLVPEVRVEVQTFYGALDSLEAQYPGLDYTYEPHRRRLSRFEWHRQLFEIFDALRLTNDEILSICQWEGTKSAKDKYEAETGRIIKDTTFAGTTSSQRTEPRATVHWRPRRQPSTETMAHVGSLDNQMLDADHSDDDIVETSIGDRLNDQLLAEADGHSPAEEGPLEEWLKYMHEREVDRDSILQAIRAGHPPPTVLEHIRASAAMASNEAVSSANSQMLPGFRNITSASQHGLDVCGPTADEILATLESRVEA